MWILGLVVLIKVGFWESLVVIFFLCKMKRSCYCLKWFIFKDCFICKICIIIWIENLEVVCFYFSFKFEGSCGVRGFWLNFMFGIIILFFGGNFIGDNNRICLVLVLIYKFFFLM